jgi:hypothetical protein
MLVLTIIISCLIGQYATVAILFYLKDGLLEDEIIGGKLRIILSLIPLVGLAYIMLCMLYKIAREAISFIPKFLRVSFSEMLKSFQK